jgi:hypothetical protein
MRHSFAMAEGDGKLARRAFIAGAIMLPIAIKVGFAFAEEAAGSGGGAQGAGATVKYRSRNSAIPVLRTASLHSAKSSKATLNGESNSPPSNTT